MSHKKYVLFINAIRPATFEALRLHEQETGDFFYPVVFVDKKIKKRITIRNGQNEHLNKVPFITVDFDSPQSIRDGLGQIGGDLSAVVSQYENSILELKKLLPYVPYIYTPSETSLEWATEKKLMREIMEAYDATLVPAYVEAHDYSEATIERIEASVEYPLIIKPSGLEGALLVSRVDNHTELQETLEKGFHKIQEAYDTWIKRQKPFFLAEEFMDGEMYSIDVYLDSNGDGICTPIVKVITGKKVGYDDFFGYVRKTPVLDISDEDLAAQTAIRSCQALNLKSITAHVELMRLRNGEWKIIELGPRIGGYRHDLYKQSFGINHIVNDILIRAGEVPTVPVIPKGHSAMYNIYAYNEGTITEILGLDKINNLASLVRINQLVSVGEKAIFAKNNGDPIFEVLMFNTDEYQFQKDCDSLEKELQIVVSK